MSADPVSNEDVADLLDHVADLLALQDTNPFRVRSYRRAAQAVRGADEPVRDLLESGGTEALQDLPGVGKRLAGAVREIVTTGRLGLAERLEGEVDPEALFSRVPGVGATLAKRIHDALGVQTLEDLELAAHDGRLARVGGVGEERLRGIRDGLAGMLGRSSRRRARLRADAERAAAAKAPPVDVLLDIDREYRDKAEAGKLRTIAPRRFNPEGKAWLPVYETERDEWEFHVLFSNTARAHDLDKTRDWVVIYYQGAHGQDQCTVVTAPRGPLEGRRVVRGRERECRAYYEDESGDTRAGGGAA